MKVNADTTYKVKRRNLKVDMSDRRGKDTETVAEYGSSCKEFKGHRNKKKDI